MKKEGKSPYYEHQDFLKELADAQLRELKREVGTRVTGFRFIASSNSVQRYTETLTALSLLTLAGVHASSIELDWKRGKDHE